MSCKHKKYIEIDITFTKRAKMIGTNKVVDVLSHSGVDDETREAIRNAEKCLEEKEEQKNE